MVFIVFEKIKTILAVRLKFILVKITKYINEYNY